MLIYVVFWVNSITAKNNTISRNIAWLFIQLVLECSGKQRNDKMTPSPKVISKITNLRKPKASRPATRSGGHPDKKYWGKQN